MLGLYNRKERTFSFDSVEKSDKSIGLFFVENVLNSADNKRAQTLPRSNSSKFRSHRQEQNIHFSFSFLWALLFHVSGQPWAWKFTQRTKSSRNLPSYWWDGGEKANYWTSATVWSSEEAGVEWGPCYSAVWTGKGAWMPVEHRVEVVFPSLLWVDSSPLLLISWDPRSTTQNICWFMTPALVLSGSYSQINITEIIRMFYTYK